MFEEQRVLLEEKQKAEDKDRLRRGLPQRWGTVKAEDEDGLTDPSIGMSAYVSVQFQNVVLSVYIASFIEIL